MIFPLDFISFGLLSSHPHFHTQGWGKGSWMGGCEQKGERHSVNPEWRFHTVMHGRQFPASAQGCLGVPWCLASGSVLHLESDVNQMYSNSGYVNLLLLAGLTAPRCPTQQCVWVHTRIDVWISLNQVQGEFLPHCCACFISGMSYGFTRVSVVLDTLSPCTGN